MRIVLFTNVISPHQIPLAREIAREFGDVNFRYIYTDESDEDHRDLNWGVEISKWCTHVGDNCAAEWLESAEVLLSGLREFDLFERRAKRGLKNLYMSERWFKPPIGILRLLHPRYFGFARQLCQMMGSGMLTCLPIGILAACDMARLCGLLHRDWSCLFHAPKLDFEASPGGKVFLNANNDHTDNDFCLKNMRMWGYFVESSQLGESNHRHQALKVLWVGRMLEWKKVNTIIHAIGELSSKISISFDIFGIGPEENRLKKMASQYGECIKFHSPVTINEVRKLMREHDVYVLASNGYEGWGAVLSEALEEGMCVLGTYEAGSSATILPKACLFHSGDWRALATLLLQAANNKLPKTAIGSWTAYNAARNLLQL